MRTKCRHEELLTTTHAKASKALFRHMGGSKNQVRDGEVTLRNCGGRCFGWPGMRVGPFSLCAYETVDSSGRLSCDAF